MAEGQGWTSQRTDVLGISGLVLLISNERSWIYDGRSQISNGLAAAPVHGQVVVRAMRVAQSPILWPGLGPRHLLRSKRSNIMKFRHEVFWDYTNNKIPTRSVLDPIVATKPQRYYFRITASPVTGYASPEKPDPIHR